MVSAPGAACAVDVVSRSCLGSSPQPLKRVTVALVRGLSFSIFSAAVALGVIESVVHLLAASMRYRAACHVHVSCATATEMPQNSAHRSVAMC